MRSSVAVFAGIAFLCAAVGRGDAPAANRPPAIKHVPATVAAAGQPLTLRAAVADDSGAVRSVSILYTFSRDAAPFRGPMEPVSAGVYLGTIPAAAASAEISYYIEAVDALGATAETPWYRVRVGAAPAAAAGKDTGKPFWRKPAWLIGGGLAAAGGAALLLDSGGGGDGGGTNAVTYSGSVTTCLQMSGEAPTCSSRAASIRVDGRGTVTSDTLLENRSMESQLSGSDFVLAAPVSSTNATGEIRFVGTVLNGRIVGSVQGSVTDAGGRAGVYSGTFSAVRAP